MICEMKNRARREKSVAAIFLFTDDVIQSRVTGGSYFRLV